MTQWLSIFWLEMGLRMQSWRVQMPQEVPGGMSRFWRLVVVTLTVEVILALWLSSYLGYTCFFHPLGCG